MSTRTRKATVLSNEEGVAFIVKVKKHLTNEGSWKQSIEEFGAPKVSKAESDALERLDLNLFRHLHSTCPWAFASPVGRVLDDATKEQRVKALTAALKEGMMGKDGEHSTVTIDLGDVHVAFGPSEDGRDKGVDFLSASYWKAKGTLELVKDAMAAAGLTWEPKNAYVKGEAVPAKTGTTFKMSTKFTSKPPAERKKTEDLPPEAGN